MILQPKKKKQDREAPQLHQQSVEKLASAQNRDYGCGKSSPLWLSFFCRLQVHDTNVGGYEGTVGWHFPTGTIEIGRPIQ